MARVAQGAAGRAVVGRVVGVRAVVDPAGRGVRELAYRAAGAGRLAGRRIGAHRARKPAVAHAGGGAVVARVAVRARGRAVGRRVLASRAVFAARRTAGRVLPCQADRAGGFVAGLHGVRGRARSAEGARSSPGSVRVLAGAARHTRGLGGARLIAAGAAGSARRRAHVGVGAGRAGVRRVDGEAGRGAVIPVECH